jgi:hypothetical protein
LPGNSGHSRQNRPYCTAIRADGEIDIHEYSFQSHPVGILECSLEQGFRHFKSDEAFVCGGGVAAVGRLKNIKGEFRLAVGERIVGIRYQLPELQPKLRIERWRSRVRSGGLLFRGARRPPDGRGQQGHDAQPRSVVIPSWLLLLHASDRCPGGPLPVHGILEAWALRTGEFLSNTREKLDALQFDRCTELQCRAIRQLRSPAATGATPVRT